MQFLARTRTSMVRKRFDPSIPADIDTTHSGALMFPAYVLIDIRGPSRAEIAGRTFEARILQALVTQMSRQGTAMCEATTAVVGTAELFVRM